jgi:hypothetical protein
VAALSSIDAVSCRCMVRTLAIGRHWRVTDTERLLPLSAVITPATINVVARNDITNISSTVPQLYYDPNNYDNLQTTALLAYIGPSPDTQRTSFGSAMTANILSIAQAQPNMTYSLDFFGPAIRCDHADEGLINAVYDSYMDIYTGVEDEYRYMAWVPQVADDPGNLSTAFKTNPSGSTDESFTLDVVSPDAAHLYIIPNTSVSGPMYVGGIPITSDDMHYGYQDLLDCKLYNASYKVLFNFTFPTQSVMVGARDLVNPVNVSTNIASWYSSDVSGGRNTHEAQRISYQAIMDSFGRLLVGQEWWRDGFVTTIESSWKMMNIDWTTRDGAQKGVEQLFQNITLSMLGTNSLL